jgi:uncharacterized protein YneF (UPF0154 family)
MWTAEFSMECKASEAKIWQVLTDVENWKEWIGSIEYSIIDASFENGTLITIKNIKAPKATNTLRDIVVNESFTLQSKLPLCTMDCTHEIVKENGVLKIKLGVRMYGALSFIFRSIFGKKLEKSLPIATKKLIELVEK